MTDTTRPVATYADTDGYMRGDSICSPTSNTVRAAVCAPAPNVVPIIFLPGIMGSNLLAKREVENPGTRKILATARSAVWRVDSATDFGFTWSRYSPADRQLLIDKDNLDVDPNGRIDLHPSERVEYDAFMRTPQYPNMGAVEQHKRLAQQVEARIADKRRRGWGTVSWAFYGPFLQWLETSLSGLSLWDGRPSPQLAAILAMAGRAPEGASGRDPQAPAAPLDRAAIERLTEFQFPVWACGYNWAASNLDSGQRLSQEIDRIIGEYDGKRGQRCTHVILVTHSMGGLVARAAAMKHGAKDRIAGIVHGVMPTHGAAAMYKRAMAGFGNEGAWFMETVVGGLLGVSAARALGRTARETLPVLAFNPGPLELAPNHRYNDGRPWLLIKDRHGRTLKALPERGDPYAEIYRRTDVWWRLVNPEWLNPARLRGNQEDFLAKFVDATKDAEKYHRELADASGFHPETYAHYSTDTRHPAWGALTVQVVASRVVTPSPYGPMPGIVVMPRPQRIDLPRQALDGTPDTWRIERHEAIDELLLRDARGGEMQARILPKSDAGDGTVPSAASAAAVDRYCRMICRHGRGYAHDASYGDDRVRNSVLDALVRITAQVPVLR